MSNAAVTLSIAQMPSHTHAWSTTSGYEFVNTAGSGYSGGSARGIAGASGTNANTGGGGAHTHSNTASSSAIDLNVKFVDVIIATKD